MTAEELRQEADRIRWYHTIDLGQGVTTDGVDATPSAIHRIGFPASFSGKSVLDVGAWDGAYSFEAERRGADRVLATDHFCWSGPGWGTKDGFDLAHQIFRSNVESLDIDVADVSAETVGKFDIVLFLGVLYHIRDPLSALERIASVTNEMLILETVVDLFYLRRPAIAFYPETELNGDPTNWCGPNAAAVIAMLKCVGFENVKIVWPLGADSLLFKTKAAARRLFRGQPPTIRMVFHAFK